MRSPTETADVRMIYAQRFDLGHAESGRRGAEPSLVLDDAGYLTGPATAADVFLNQEPFHDSSCSLYIPLGSPKP